VTGERLPPERVAWSPFPAGGWQERATVEPGSRAERAVVGRLGADIDHEQRLASFVAPVGEVYLDFALEGYGEGDLELEVRAGTVNRVTVELTAESMLELGFEAALIEAIDEEFDGSDFARFAPSASDAAELAAAVERCRGLLRRIGKTRVARKKQSVVRRSALDGEATAGRGD